MKPMSLLVCGIVLSSAQYGADSARESSSGNFALRPNTQASMQDWRKEQVRGAELTESGAAWRFAQAISQVMCVHVPSRIAEAARISIEETAH